MFRRLKKARAPRPERCASKWRCTGRVRRAFQTPAQLKALLVQDRGAFVSCLVEKLLTYSLGRGLERYDKPAQAEIIARLPSQDYKFSELVLDVVTSLPFQMRSARRNGVAVTAEGDRSR